MMAVPISMAVGVGGARISAMIVLETFRSESCVLNKEIAANSRMEGKLDEVELQGLFLWKSR